MITPGCPQTAVQVAQGPNQCECARELNGTTSITKFYQLLVETIDTLSIRVSYSVRPTKINCLFTTA